MKTRWIVISVVLLTALVGWYSYKWSFQVKWEEVLLSEPYQFPFRKQDQSGVTYSNSWGAPRTYGGKRKHEGIDLMAAKGTPVISVSGGKIVRKGWNRLGGWTFLIEDRQHPHIYYYYAHLSRYANRVDEGEQVQKGQLIAYVGDSGYGPEGTTGQFPPHLHFGIYIQENFPNPRFYAVNPYPFLKIWQTHS